MSGLGMAIGDVLDSYRIIKANPVKMRRMNKDYPRLAGFLEVADRLWP